MQYEESLKQYRDLNNVINTSFEEGETKGKIEGEREGIIKGKMDVARNALRKGLPIDVIAELTGLSEEDIEKLK